MDQVAPHRRCCGITKNLILAGRILVSSSSLNVRVFCRFVGRGPTQHKHMRARTNSNHSRSTTDSDDHSKEDGLHNFNSKGSNTVAGAPHSGAGRRERTTSQSGHDDMEQQNSMLVNTSSTVSSTESSPAGTNSPSRLRRAAASSIFRSGSSNNIGSGKPARKQQAPPYRWTQRWVVDWIQSIRIRNGPLITGLDRVLIPGGTASCAEAVRIAGVQPPRYLWYMLSGSGCDILQLATLFALKTVVHLRDASMIWCLGFLINIPCRHTSHRYLVFGDYVGGYWHSLARMYAGYSVIIVLSTLFNFIMSRLFADSIAMPMLWLTTMLWTGVVNYFILRRLWSFGGSPADKDPPSQLP